ncbi:MAG: NADPH:quinone oxidoreductase family protein [Rhodospirillales bacterium]
MRAIVATRLGTPQDLTVQELPTPVPGRGEVLVHVRAAAINFPDILVIAGKYQVRPPLPFVPGKECAGVVAALGPETSGFAVGEPVMVQVEYGAFAEAVAVPATHCYRMPPGIGFDAAAAVGIAYQTAHFALVDRAQMKAGDKVLVTGATGSVGIAAMQLAKAFGCTVIAGVTTPAKAEVARENGADHVVDLTVPDIRDRLRADVRDAVGGGVDVVVEIVGGEVFEAALRTLEFRGRLVVVGFTGGVIPAVKANYLLLKNIAVTGVNWSEYRDRDAAWVHRVQDEIFGLCVAGRLHVPVQARFPLDDFAAGFAVLEDRRVRGKVVLTMDG